MKSVVRMIAVAAVLWLVPPHGPAISGGAKSVVVELFTSQGCSRCRPADAHLAELAGRDDVIALSFHVDYWNYTGWRDPFSSARFSARQHSYSRTLHRRYVYTPQMVIDGADEIIGSKRQKVERLIASAADRKKIPVILEHRNPHDARIRIPAAAYNGPPAAIWIAFYDRRHSTLVESGENSGETIINANVVRALRRVGTWRGQRVELKLDLEKLGSKGREGCAVLVQAGGSGRILGATEIALAGMAN